MIACFFAQNLYNELKMLPFMDTEMGGGAMAGEKVLIVDDEAAVRKVLSRVISTNGMDCEMASSGEQALDLLKSNQYDLIIMDVMMGEVDGFEVVRMVRKQGLDTPIIILSAKNEDYNTIYGLDIGADDYVAKPFNPVVLGAKVKALIRRDRKASLGGRSTILAGPFSYSTDTMKLCKNGSEIMLSAKESMMAKLFMENIGKVFSKEQLYEKVWGDNLVDENAIMVYISHLPNKLEDDPKKPEYIKTVWGIGYQFNV